MADKGSGRYTGGQGGSRQDGRDTGGGSNREIDRSPTPAPTPPTPPSPPVPPTTRK